MQIQFGLDVTPATRRNCKEPKTALKAAKLLPLEEKRKIHEAGLSGKLPTSTYREYAQTRSLKQNRSAERAILTIPIHRNEQFKNSPIYRTINTWNSILQQIKELETTTTFKNAYQNHLKKTYEI